MRPMIPESLLRYSLKDGVILPAYLDRRDHPWISSLIDVYRSYAGKPRRLLSARLLEDLPVASPPGKRRLAIHALERLSKVQARHGGLSPKLRQALFSEAAARIGSPTPFSRDETVANVARLFSITPQCLEETLFADLPEERAVPEFEERVSPPELALRANLALIQGFLFRAAKVEMELLGNSRAVVRQAKLRGLLTTVRNNPENRTATLEVSGPFSLFRKTLLYGRSLSEIVPLLAWCDRFELRADCMLRRGQDHGSLRLKTGDPFLPSNPPRAFDSALEERFAKSFRKLAPDWDIIREPEPIAAGGTLIFPDFLLRHRRDPERCFMLEIVGFWTPEYLAKKFERLCTARITNLILCVDETLNCADSAVPGAEVIFFKRKLDPAAIISRLERS